MKTLDQTVGLFALTVIFAMLFFGFKIATANYAGSTPEIISQPITYVVIGKATKE